MQNMMNSFIKSDIYNHLLMVLGLPLVILAHSDQVRTAALFETSQLNYAIRDLQIQDFT
jgi:hypothetical protein